MNIPLWISSSIVLDARRAVWFPKESTLAIADLQMGAPQETAGEETVAQLLALAADYQPERILFFGRILHPEATEAGVATRFSALLTALKERTGVVFLAQEPGPVLGTLLAQGQWSEGCRPFWQCGRHHFLNHRDDPSPPLIPEGEERALALVASEFPAIHLGKSSPVRCPAFVLGGNRLLVPPFFSQTPLRDEMEWAFSLPDEAPWERCVAIAAGKLLIRPLGAP